jgi:NADPH-dependent 2,4-dienoyl-CoA reductase/sulfur reductase-like enzyme
VIVGGGFGGLLATKVLRKGDVEITLVDRTNHHLFQPLLYQVATGILSVGDVAPPLRGILRKHRTSTSRWPRSPASTSRTAGCTPPGRGAPGSRSDTTA